MLERTLNISIPEGAQQAYQPRIRSSHLEDGHESRHSLRCTLEEAAEASDGHDLVVKRLMQDDLRRKEKEVDSMHSFTCPHSFYSG